MSTRTATKSPSRSMVAPRIPLPRLTHWLMWLALILVPGSALAVALVSGPEVVCDGNRATIRWQLDTEAGARVRYGTALNRLEQRADGPVGTHHTVVLEPLQAGTTYYYTIGTARRVLATNSFATPSGPHANTPTTAPPPQAPTLSKLPAASSDEAPPPTRATWNDLSTLQDHFNRHGRDVGAQDPDDYAGKAWQFLQEARREGWPAKRDTDGNLRVWNPKTRAFASYTRAGKTRTHFRASRAGYFDDQPGTPVNLKSP